MDNHIIEKVSKLLTRAENNPFAGEAQACMLKAQALMVEYNLSMDDITGCTGSKEVVEGDLTGYGRQAWWKQSLSVIIARNFRCKSLKQANHAAQSKLFLLGLKEDVEIARSVFEFAVEAIHFHSGQYLKEVRKKGIPTRGIKNTYILGFITGLKDQFAEQVNKNEWGLVLVVDPVVTEAYERLNRKKGRRCKIKVAEHEEAREKGYLAGKNFNTPTGRLEPGI